MSAKTLAGSDREMKTKVRFPALGSANAKLTAASIKPAGIIKKL